MRRRVTVDQPATGSVGFQPGFMWPGGGPRRDARAAGSPGRVYLDTVGHHPGLGVLDGGGGPVDAPAVLLGGEVGDLEARARPAVLPARGGRRRAEGHQAQCGTANAPHGGASSEPAVAARGTFRAATPRNFLKWRWIEAGERACARPSSRSRGDRQRSVLRLGSARPGIPRTAQPAPDRMAA